MDPRTEQRVCIKFYGNLGKSATETFAMIQKVFGGQSMSRTRVFEWHARFRAGRTDVEDDAHTGRPVSSTTPAATFVPRILTADQKAQRVEVCMDLRQTASDDPTFLSRVITGGESWIYGYDPETKQQSSQW